MFGHNVMLTSILSVSNERVNPTLFIQQIVIRYYGKHNKNSMLLTKK